MQTQKLYTSISYNASAERNSVDCESRLLFILIKRAFFVSQRACSVLFAIIITLFAYSQANAQNNGQNSTDTTDSLLTQFNASPSYKVANKIMSMLYSASITDEQYSYDKSTPRDTLTKYVWYWAAEYYYAQQRYERASDYAYRALPLFHSSNSIDMEADCANLLAISYVRQGKLDHALVYAQMCYKLDSQSGDKDRISSSLNTLTSIYFSAGKYAEAEQYVLKAIELGEEADNKTRLAILYGTASEVYYKLDDPRKSYNYAKKSYDLEMQLGRKEKAAIRLTQMSSAQISLQKYKEAQKALDEAIPLLIKSGNTHSLGIAYNNQGLIEYYQHRDRAAESNFRKALAIFVEQGDLINESYSRKGLSWVLKESNPTEALEHNNRYLEIRDSLYRRNSEYALEKYATEYRTEELQQENSNLTDRMHTIVLITLVLVVLLAIGSWITVQFFNAQSKKRTDMLLREIESLRETEEADKSNRPDLPDNTGKPDLADNQETPNNSEKTAATDNQLILSGNQMTNEQFIYTVKEIVGTHIAMASNVEKLATTFNMTAQTFRRRLKLLTGELPKTWLSNIQMDKACELLRERDDLTVVEISEMCGFTDASNFTRTFRKKFDISPRDYREKMKVEN